MTTPRDTPASRRSRANGDGTVYQRKDGRWEAAGYVLAPGNTRRRVRVYGTTRKEALAKLTEKIAASHQAHRQGHPHLAQPAPHHLPVLHPPHRHPARPAPAAAPPVSAAASCYPH